MTQADRVLALLRERGSAGVTPLLAQNRVGTMRLAARVADLKKLGHRIRTERHTTPNGAVVARYVLEERPVTRGEAMPIWR